LDQNGIQSQNGEIPPKGSPRPLENLAKTENFHLWESLHPQMAAFRLWEEQKTTENSTVLALSNRNQRRFGEITPLEPVCFAF
jgi:hypothetical protein